MLRNHKKLICPAAKVVFVILLVELVVWWFFWPPVNNRDILRIANSFEDGGGYCDLSDTGVSEDIVVDGFTVLRKSEKGTYCCGFTYMVVMRAAEERGLLEDTEPYQMKLFQREWYGATAGSRIKQVATAMETLGIGHEVTPAEARPGDFAVYTRKDGFGHSVVFLGWIQSADGKILGLRYRSSQGETDGVATTNGFFADSGIGSPSSGIDRDLLYFGRLDRPWWSHLLYPFSS